MKCQNYFRLSQKGPFGLNNCYRDIINHCYQRGADGIVLFYSVSDHLVYFTTYCLLAKKHNVKVLSLCQMPDHVHDTVVVKKVEQLSCFKQEVSMT